MKKIYVTLAAAALATLSLSAQEQLPNAGFEEGWGDCTPWVAGGNSKTIGQTPSPWTISQVIGINGTGATQVGEKVEGYESASAVSVYNSPNSTLKTQKVPGYVTLGTTWSTSQMGKNNDGGTFGGILFSSRPESISFMYKRAHGSGSSEAATVVAYLWKGSTTQKDVPASITAMTLIQPKKVDMVNRDRNILGMTTSKGGAVTKSSDFELIAKIDYQITGDAADWTELIIPFEYFSDATPEMFNVIFAAGDYWNDKPTEGDNLIIDNVKLNYPAVQLNSFKGNLLINMSGSELNANDDTEYSVNLYEAGEGKCDLILPNFALTSIGLDNLGDISVENVTMTTAADGTTTYVGHKDNLSLAQGEIIADVDCNGKSLGGYVYMDIQVTWKMGYDPASPDAYDPVPISVAFSGLEGDAPAMPALYLVADGAEEYTEANKFTYADGVYTLETKTIPENLLIKGDYGMPCFGAAPEATAAEGALGTLDSHLGSATAHTGTYALTNEKNNFIIKFAWDGKATTIAPEVTEKIVSGIADIEAADEAEAVYYNLQGVRVAQPTTGFYIKVAGDKATKVRL